MQYLFSEFSPIDKQRWKDQAIQDLKGKPFESLLWKTPEGFSLEPYYTAQDVNVSSQEKGYLPPPATLAGGEPRQWTNMQYLFVNNEKEANEQALLALNGGATGLYFDLDGLAEILPDMQVLLKGVLLEHCAIAFRSGSKGEAIWNAFENYAQQQGLEATQLQGFIAFDPLGHLPETGFKDNDSLSEWDAIVEATQDYSHFRGFVMDSRTYHNAGASASQEIAFLLSLTAEYLHRLTEAGVEPTAAFANLGYSVALGSRYFVEIAKLRALRMLVAQMARAYGLTAYSSDQLYIHAYTGRWSKTRLDSYTNLLRNTTEAMSGILGGCNSLTVSPHDHLTGELSPFSLRIARNVSTILQEEAYFGKVQDPVAGAYYPELLTQQLMSESWKIFLQIEEAGGYTSFVESGKMQELVNTTRDARTQEINFRRQRIVGANAYANPAEELPLPELKANTNASNMLIQQQGQADAFEQLRWRTQQFREREGRLPEAMLLQFGDGAMRRARAAFASDFLRTAGIKISELTLREGEISDQLPLELPDIIVLCAADEDYNQQAVWLADQLRQRFAGMLLVAGNPDVLSPEIKKAALDGFVHLKANAVQLLTEVQDKTFAQHEA